MNKLKQWWNNIFTKVKTEEFSIKNEVVQEKDKLEQKVVDKLYPTFEEFIQVKNDLEKILERLKRENITI